MKFFKRYKKEIFTAVVLFFILQSGMYLFFRMLQDEKIATFKHNTLKQNALLLHTVRNGLNGKSDVIFAIKVNQPNVLQIMNDANNAAKRDEARKKLYALLEPTYELLKKNGIRQLHFHLPGNISFLRFHKPNKYGDSLKGIRYSIDLVNKTKKVVRGFEEGRIFNGFRNVYPLFYNDKFVGTVEISYSIRAIATTLTQSENAFYGLLIQKDLVQKKVWKENRKYYVPSLFSDEYLWDKKTFSTLYYYKNKEKFFNGLREVERTLSKKIQPLLKKKESFLLPFGYHDKNFIVIFQVLQNIAKQRVGYIVTFSQNNFFAQSNEHYRMTLAIASLVDMALSILFFLFLKTERDIKSALSFRSNYDPLTRLLNRRGFETTYNAIFKTHKRHKQPFALLFLDIDHFKHINDTYGHDIGDAVLEELAKILKQTLRDSDIIARWGGEEFVVLLNDTNADAAKKVAQKLKEKIEEHTHATLPSFTVSIGVANGEASKSFEQLLKEADEALYRAKKEGRNRIVIYS